MAHYLGWWDRFDYRQVNPSAHRLHRLLLTHWRNVAIASPLPAKPEYCVNGTSNTSECCITSLSLKFPSFMPLSGRES